MKILKRGKPPEEKVYQHTCKHCTTRVEFTGKDPEVQRQCSRGYDEGDFFRFMCPVCHKECIKYV